MARLYLGQVSISLDGILQGAADAAAERFLELCRDQSWEIRSTSAKNS
jgi:hypothetical protein